MKDYIPKTAPFAHQSEALARSYKKRCFALFLDQGLGKSKIVIDNAAILYQHNVITGLLILSLNGVHEQWIEEQIPLHLPDSIERCTAAWRSSSAKRQRDCASLCKNIVRPPPLYILAMNHDAIITAAGQLTATAFLKAHQSMLVLDESHHFKTPKAKRTRIIEHRLKPLAQVRRILTGTPTESPFDYFAQFRFLDERILGFDSLLAFKHHFAVFTTEYTKAKDAAGRPCLRSYESLQSFQHLEELHTKIAPYTYRKLKEECLDLPPKLYATRKVEMTPAQQKLYQQLKAESFALLQQVNEGNVDVALIPELEPEELLTRVRSRTNRVSIQIKLTLILRLLQISGGFVTDDAGTTRAIDASPTPKLEAALDLVQNARGQCLIWAQYRAELCALLAHLKSANIDAALIYGDTPEGERSDLLKRFKTSASPRVLIAHPKTLGTGQNLQAAQTVIYYSNSYSHIQRTQSEDRVHRIGQQGTVSVYDLVASNADEEVLKALRAKRDINSLFDQLEKL